MQPDNIPLELRQLPQWVASGKNKIPVNPITKRSASVTDPSTWGTYEEAKASGLDYIGFVLTAEAGYTIIDLDDKPEHPATPEQLALHAKILDHFESYTERSASGRGYHIIVKGLIPTGVHRDNVEMYSSARFMICTGNVVKGLPIADYQPSLNNMYGQMKPPERAQLDEHEETLGDSELFDMAMNASNGEKFNALCCGDQTGYPSQSEADLALLSILAFYTKSNEQVRRLFRMTALGKREKAVKNDVYLNYAIGKIRGNELPPIDLSALMRNAEAVSPPPPPGPIKHEQLIAPPGLVGDIAQYILASSARPVPEIALAAALAFFSGICGRQFNTNTHTGLNQYVILLAGTGRGKEGASSGIDRLFAALRTRIPAVESYRGPSSYSSGPAILKSMAANPCLLSVLGEFGYTLQNISDPKSNSAEKSYLRVLLDLYSKSGANSTLGVSKYSNKEDDTAIVNAPCLTLLGESTQEAFLSSMDESMISAGLIPRFLIIEYTGTRPYLNENAGFSPPQALVDKIAAVVETVVRMYANQSFYAVPLNPEAYSMSKEFEHWTTDQINEGTGGSTIAELWNRAHLKALKLASLLAIGVDQNNPVVTGAIFAWARDFAIKDVNRLASRFSTGDVGSGDSKHIADLTRVVSKFLHLSAKEIRQLRDTEAAMHKAKIVPKGYLQRNTANLASYKNHRLGATQALNVALQNMLDSESLIELSKVELKAKINSTAAAYGIGPGWKG